MKISTMVGARPQFIEAGVATREPGLAEGLLQAGRRVGERIARASGGAA